MQAKICIHCFVSGLVQGVGFRAVTHEEAHKLGLTGWVRNLPDDRVEVLACGEREKVMQLAEWLKRGPKRARVSDWQCVELPYQDHDGFNIT
jgi:acylphosphatase